MIGRGCERFEGVVELNREHGLGLRQRDEIEFGLEHDAERAFGADHQLGKIERFVRTGELVEIVAADAAQHFGKSSARLRRRTRAPMR